MGWKWSLRKAFGLPEEEYGELMPGVIRPSYALAGMVAAHIIKHADKVSGDSLVLTSRERTRYMDNRDRAAKFKDDKMSVSVLQYFKDTASRLSRSGYNYQPYGSATVSVLFNQKLYDFSADEKKLIANAMRKACEIGAALRETKEAEKQQLDACDIINELFGPPIEDVPGPNEKESA